LISLKRSNDIERKFSIEDGISEMNVHIPQNVRAESEIRVLMNINHKIISAQNNAPVADAGVDQTVHVGDVVYFNGTGYDSDGIIVLEEWDYDGDGIYDWNSTLKMASTHIYDVVGNYTATFRTSQS